MKLARILWFSLITALAAARPAHAEPSQLRSIVSHGHYLAFYVTPGRLPAIVLDAGGGLDAAYWRPLIDDLSKRTGAEIISYDRAGMGKSDEVKGPWDAQEATDDLEAGLRKLGATHNVVLVSHSLAGTIATYLALRHPDWFKGAVLADASIPEFYTPALMVSQIADYSAVLPALQAAPSTPANRQLLALAASFSDTFTAFHKVAWPAAVPVIAIVSEKTPFDRPADARWWRDAQALFVGEAPNRRLVTADRSSHDIAHDRPDVILQAVLDVRNGGITSPNVTVSPRATAAIYDVVIRNGHVLDGEGNPWINADVAIKDGRFAKIGRVEGHGAKEIDATGHYVSPGWIDMMDQSGDVLPVDGTAVNKLREGITTAIAGEDGSPVPSAKLNDYFDRLQRQGISLNFGTYYGASQARREVIGDIDGLPTPAQLDQERAHVAEAMRAGAMGIATALIYAPNSYQKTDELIELSKVAKQYGGIYASHMRDEGEDLLNAIRESIEIGQKAGIEVEIFHFKGAYAPGWGKLVPAAGRLIDDARAHGVNIAADMYVYTAGGTGLDITVPNWVWAQGKVKGLARLADPAVRARLKQEVATGSEPGWTNLLTASGGWDHVVLVDGYAPQYTQYRFKSLTDIGKALHRDPADVAWDIVLAAQPNRATALYFGMSEGDIETALKFPWMSIGSDAEAVVANDPKGFGLVHPRAFGNFPRVIAHYVRDRGVLTLPDAIRKMTSWPASRMGLFDRGAIREGLRADVTIFNYDTIADTATYQHPGEFPQGIDYVLVNGQLVVDHGIHNGAKPGMVLRGPGWTGAAAPTH